MRGLNRKSDWAKMVWQYLVPTRFGPCLLGLSLASMALLGCMALFISGTDLRIRPGAEQTQLYLPLLKNKRVALLINHTSRVGQLSLVDYLRSNGIQIVKIFVPEHGLAGNADDGGQIKDSVYPQTTVPAISLYGKKTKPTSADLSGVDILVFDIQDVGVRFYTYISSLQRLMEAAVENNKPLIILDRPDPNGFYVDGPVLDMKSKSFAGLQPVPVVYGMTIGEYAKMLVGENWLDLKPRSKAKDLQLTVVPNLNYTHQSLYEPPVSPSPNLPTIQSIYWYPSIGLMEGSRISVGRGTNQPFQVFGDPQIHSAFTFVPRRMRGAKEPLYDQQVVHGWSVAGTKNQVLKAIDNKLQIKYFIQAYHADPNIFAHLPSRKTQKSSLESQIKAGMNEQQIRASWEPKLTEFKKIRKKYLLYPDYL